MSIYGDLRRTVIKEDDLFVLRRIVSEHRYYDTATGLLDLTSLCVKEARLEDINPPEDDLTTKTTWLKSKTKQIEHRQKYESNIYCQLHKLWLETENIPGVSQDEFNKDIMEIYNLFTRNLLRKDRRRFNKLIKIVLEHDNPVNTIKMFADYIRNTDNLEEFLKGAKYQEYTRYEKSFVSDYFSEKRTKLTLEYKTQKFNKRLVDRIIDILSKRTSPSTVVGELYDGIRTNYTAENMIKADLVCKKPITDPNGDVIINVGDFIEVKKLDVAGDSYLSEFLSIYKSPDRLPKIAFTPEFKQVYNKVIDELWSFLSTNGNDILQDIKNNFKGIIYDDNTFVDEDYITLYWSNKGQRQCTADHRLSIRYRIDKDNVPSYKLDVKTGVGTPVLSNGAKMDLVNCPISF
jgi:hypothetical protein